MILECVLTAVNENPLYMDFIPLFVKAWKKLYPLVDVKIIFIASDIPAHLQDYKDYLILFHPIPNISTSFVSQYIRLLYPSILNYTGGVLITDMDMLPMNNKYYTECIRKYDANKFIYYREKVCFEFQQLAMCYNIATPAVWSDIFNIYSIQDIRNRLQEVYNSIQYIEGHGHRGWCTDQIHLYARVQEWDSKTRAFICLSERDTGFKRLDRSVPLRLNNATLKSDISSGVYSDYHCLRPFEKYKDINNQIVDWLS